MSRFSALEISTISIACVALISSFVLIWRVIRLRRQVGTADARATEQDEKRRRLDSLNGLLKKCESKPEVEALAMQLVDLANEAMRRAKDERNRRLRWSWANVVLGFVAALGAGGSGGAVLSGATSGPGATNVRLALGIIGLVAAAAAGLASSMNTARTSQSAALAANQYTLLERRIWNFLASLPLLDCNAERLLATLDARTDQLEAIAQGEEQAFGTRSAVVQRA